MVLEITDYGAALAFADKAKAIPLRTGEVIDPTALSRLIDEIAAQPDRVIDLDDYAVKGRA